MCASCVRANRTARTERSECTIATELRANPQRRTRRTHKPIAVCVCTCVAVCVCVCAVRVHHHHSTSPLCCECPTTLARRNHTVSRKRALVIREAHARVSAPITYMFRVDVNAVARRAARIIEYFGADIYESTFALLYHEHLYAI